MAETGKPTVYKWTNIDAVNAHFENMHSWFRAEETDRRIITGPAHDDYVSSEQINDFVGGSVPRRLLIATDEDIDVVGDPRRLEQLRKIGRLS